MIFCDQNISKATKKRIYDTIVKSISITHWKLVWQTQWYAIEMDYWKI